MSKTLDLRAVVSGILNTIVNGAEKVYFQQAEKGAQKYIVYTLDEVLREDERTSLELEVNVVDYGADTSAVDTLADTIQATFDKKVVIADNIAVYFYIDRRNNVTEEDRLVLRRRLTFSTYLYER